MTRTELGWIAGIIDGEGCIFISKSKPPKKRPNINISYQVVVRVGMTSQLAINTLMNLVGYGSVHCKEEHNPYSPCWFWTVTCRDAERFLWWIEPHLVAKREEAQVALEFFKLPPVFNRSAGVPPETLAAREDICIRLQQLKTVNQVKARKAALGIK